MNPFRRMSFFVVLITRCLLCTIDPTPPVFNNCTDRTPFILDDGDDPITLTFNDDFLETIMDQGEIAKLEWWDFSVNELVLSQDDAGSGKAVTIYVRDTFDQTANCTLYYQVEGMFDYNLHNECLLNTVV